MTDERLRQIFIENTSVTEEQIDKAAEIAERTGESLGAVLQMLGVVTDEERVRCLALKLGLEYVDLTRVRPSPELLRLIPADIQRKHCVVPVSVHVTLAVANPLDALAGDTVAEVQREVGCSVTAAVASEGEIRRILDSLDSPGAEGPEAAEPEGPAPSSGAEPTEASEYAEEALPEAGEPEPELDFEDRETDEPDEDVLEAEIEEEEPDEGSAVTQLPSYAMKFIEILREERPISDREIEEAARATVETEEDIGEALVRLGVISESARVRAQGRQWGIEFFDLTDFEPDPAIVGIVHIEQLMRYGVLPVKLEDTTLYVAAVNPVDLNVIDSLTVTTGYQVRAYIAIEEDIRRILGQLASEGRSE